VIWFRHADRRYPFLWETADQPPARWHGPGDGPVQYLSSTPDGAWAEFLRHEDIRDEADLQGIDRSLWAVEVDEALERLVAPVLEQAALTGDESSYPACRAEARRLLSLGASGLRSSSAALRRGCARGERVTGGLVEAPDADGESLVLFGPRPAVRGWRCAELGRPNSRLLRLVRHFDGPDDETA
jgi:hypothetical protein